MEVKLAVPGSVLEVHAVASDHCHLKMMANLPNGVPGNNLTIENVGAFHRLVSIVLAPLVVFRITFRYAERRLNSLLRLRLRRNGPAPFGRWRSSFLVVFFLVVFTLSGCFLSSWRFGSGKGSRLSIFFSSSSFFCVWC